MPKRRGMNALVQHMLGLDELQSERADEGVGQPAEYFHVDEHHHKRRQYSDEKVPDDLWGSDEKLIVRHFNQQSYTGPKTEDFLARARAIYAAGCRLAGKKDQAIDKATIIDKLEEHYYVVQQSLKKQCQIAYCPPDRRYRINGEDSPREQETMQTITKAKELLCGFVVDVVQAIDPEADETLVKELQQEEAHWTADQGRPNLLHVYSTSSDDAAGEKRFSCQQVFEGYTLPSTVRNQAVLSNLVRIGIGSVSAERRVQTDFVGYRHSSYPPIHEKDAIERYRGAVESAKQMIRVLAEQQLQGQDRSIDQEEPLRISLTSLALLSPIRFDSIVMGNNSDERQLQEVHLALMSINQQIITLQIDGKKVLVQPDISLMNASANSPGYYAKRVGMLAPIQQKVQAKGFFEYIEHMRAFVDPKSFYDLGRRIEQVPSKSQDIVRSVIDLSAQLFGMYSDLELPQIRNNITDLQRQYNLPALYDRLQQIANQYNQASDPKKRKACKQEYDRMLKNIRNIEKLFDEQYQAFAKVAKKGWQHYKAQAEKLCNDIQTLLTDDSLKDFFDTDYGRQLRELCLFQEAFIDSVALHYDNELFSKEQALQFHARYLICNQMMGREVDFYCKSGEDRTGRLQNLIEEFFSFKQNYGYFPRYLLSDKHQHEQDRVRQQQLARRVHDYSVSQEICGWNAHGARGLQMRNDLGVNADLHVNTGLAMAYLAKKHLYEKVKLKKQSQGKKRKKGAKKRLEVVDDAVGVEMADFSAIRAAEQARNNEVAVKAEYLPRIASPSLRAALAGERWTLDGESLSANAQAAILLVNESQYIESKDALQERLEKIAPKIKVTDELYEKVMDELTFVARLKERTQDDSEFLKEISKQLVAADNKIEAFIKDLPEVDEVTELLEEYSKSRLLQSRASCLRELTDCLSTLQQHLPEQMELLPGLNMQLKALQNLRAELKPELSYQQLKEFMLYTQDFDPLTPELLRTRRDMLKNLDQRITELQNYIDKLNNLSRLQDQWCSRLLSDFDAHFTESFRSLQKAQFIDEQADDQTKVYINRRQWIRIQWQRFVVWIMRRDTVTWSIPQKVTAADQLQAAQQTLEDLSVALPRLQDMVGHGQESLADRITILLTRSEEAKQRLQEKASVIEEDGEYEFDLEVKDAEASRSGLQITEALTVPEIEMVEFKTESQSIVSADKVAPSDESDELELVERLVTSLADVVSKMHTTIQKYDGKGRIGLQDSTVHYTSPEQSKNKRLRQHSELYVREKDFILETIVALVHERSVAHKHDAVRLGGHDVVLVRSAYATVKALGLEVEFAPEAVKIDATSKEMREKIERYQKRPEVQEARKQLFAASAVKEAMQDAQLKPPPSLSM